MCGIAGYVDYGQRLGPERLAALVGAMTQALSHRGPDDAGVWVDPSGMCALGQRRLSILDLSTRGRQPMELAPGDHLPPTVLTFNGEIYNYRELRARLEADGEEFHTQTDTEVLLHLLARSEHDCLTGLRGMFAFGAWKPRERRLLLARDPFGKKPLYLARGDGWLAFASELRAIELVPGLDRTITRDSLAEFLWLQYTHAPRTIYRGVSKLPPGTCAVVNGDGTLREHRYFEFRPVPVASRPRAESEQQLRVDQLGEVVESAVARRLVSDVPLGAFLSGGNDSALVVSMMRRLGCRPITFSVGFVRSPDSEHEAAREIARHLECEHHEVLLEPDAIALAPRIAEVLDEPNGDSSCLPTYLLSEFTRRHVTVALSGDGGDEMFGGYGRYLDVLEEGVEPRPGWSPSSAYLGPRWSIFQTEQIRRLLGGVPESLVALQRGWAGLLDRVDLPIISRMRLLDVRTYLPGAVLAKVDRMSMMFALEVRCPLLDVDVASFAATLHPDECVGDSSAGRRVGKRILKDLLGRYLPREWVDRKKVGFGLPAGFWNGPALRDFARDLLDGPSTCLHAHVDRRALREWLEAQESPSHFSIYRLWPMLILELWLRRRPAEDVPASPPVGDASTGSAPR